MFTIIVVFERYPIGFRCNYQRFPARFKNSTSIGPRTVAACPRSRRHQDLFLLRQWYMALLVCSRQDLRPFSTAHFHWIKTSSQVGLLSLNALKEILDLSQCLVEHSANNGLLDETHVSSKSSRRRSGYMGYRSKMSWIMWWGAVKSATLQWPVDGRKRSLKSVESLLLLFSTTLFKTSSFCIPCLLLLRFYWYSCNRPTYVPSSTHRCWHCAPPDPRYLRVDCNTVIVVLNEVSRLYCNSSTCRSCGVVLSLSRSYLVVLKFLQSIL
jgi:hypothetical protein